MILSDKFEEAHDLVADMPFNDPGGIVRKKLEKLEKEIPESEAEYFGYLWEAYIANTE